MADAGVVRDANRLPWLEPYRAPPRKQSNRRPGLTAVVGAVGLAAVVTLLTRDVIPFPADEPIPQASIVLPAPVDLQPQIILPALKAPEEMKEVEIARPAPARRRAAYRPARRIKAVPTRAAYRDIMDQQSEEAVFLEAELTEAALAIASLPLPPDPPRPAVNPSAKVVRGKTVQLGVFINQREAEAAWQSAIRDYTYLVTMPKSIEPITIRSKRYYRLQLGTPSKRYAKQLCTNLQSLGRSCTVA